MSIAEAKERLNTLSNLLNFVDADKRFRIAINIAIECMDKEVASWGKTDERTD